MLYWV